jgi:hypothetical protein
MIVASRFYEYKNLMKFHKPENPSHPGEGTKSSVFRGIPEEYFMDGRRLAESLNTLYALRKTF